MDRRGRLITTGWSKNIGKDEDRVEGGWKQAGWSKTIGMDENAYRVEQEH